MLAGRIPKGFKIDAKGSKFDQIKVYDLGRKIEFFAIPISAGAGWSEKTTSGTVSASICDRQCFTATQDAGTIK